MRSTAFTLLNLLVLLLLPPEGFAQSQGSITTAPLALSFSIAAALAILLIVSPRLLRFWRTHQINREKGKLLAIRQAAETHAMRREQTLQMQQSLFLEAALAGDTSIRMSMLPPNAARTIEWLRSVAVENYLMLSHLKNVLGDNTLDWHVELLRLIEQEQNRDSFELHLTRQQAIQALNSHLNCLQRSDTRAA
ncbi:MAG: hypothetical protein HWE11_13475 [Gammaproteobacteria bacterium]|nr:hypothetical protein [Gammaproteobacteria bacterium]